MNKRHYDEGDFPRRDFQSRSRLENRTRGDGSVEAPRLPWRNQRWRDESRCGGGTHCRTGPAAPRLGAVGGPDRGNREAGEVGGTARAGGGIVTVAAGMRRRERREPATARASAAVLEMSISQENWCPYAYSVGQKAGVIGSDSSCCSRTLPRRLPPRASPPRTRACLLFAPSSSSSASSSSSSPMPPKRVNNAQEASDTSASRAWLHLLHLPPIGAAHLQSLHHTRQRL